MALVVACLFLAGCGGGDGGDDKDAPQIPLAGDTGTASDTVEVPSAPRGLHLVRVGSFDSPTYLTAPPGDAHRLFVVEQPGVIWIVRDGRIVRTPFLDLRGDVLAGGERGLLSMAFAPDYSRSRRFYVYYTGDDGDIHIQEFRTSAGNPGRADLSTRRELLRLEHREFSNHNGGQLQFGPDGMLYAGFGDGGGGGDPHRHAQDKSVLYGKLVRMDAGASHPRPEVFAYGLRNPWRFSFDSGTGDMVIADVGQDEIEEVDFAPKGQAAGRNWGWNVFEGGNRYSDGSAPGATPPVITHNHSDGWCSITGGYVVRDPKLTELEGQYVYGDFCEPRLWAAKLTKDGAEDDHPLDLRVRALSSFGVDGRGRVYALSLSGPVYRLAE